MEKLLSVIIPTYNMERYLQNNLASLIVSEGLDSLEVIVVNDGSQDRSSEIAHEYANRYPSVFCVIDKKNGNYGSCINAALKVATGKYVKIMDADDSFVTENFQILIERLKAVDVDLILTDYIKTYISRKIIEYNFNLPKEQVMDIESVYNTQALYDILLPAITYRTEILKRINYHQTEGISYTDTQWCFTPVTQVKTVYYLDKCVYRYLMGREGQTMDPAVLKRTMPQRLQCFSALLHDIKDIPLTPYMKEFTTRQLVKHAYYFYSFYLKEYPGRDRSELENFDTEFKVLNPEAYNRCNKFQYRLHIPYYYVAEWRTKRKDIPWGIKFLGRCLDVIGTIHIKLFMRSNPNEPR